MLGQEKTQTDDASYGAIEVSGLRKVYNSGSDDPTLALTDIDAEIEPGEFVSIIGPSGSGKTTLLKCIGDIVTPSDGSISVDGETPSVARKERRFAFFFQEDVLLPWRTVIENITLPLEIKGGYSSEKAQTVAKEMLERVGLQGFENHHPNELSGGMRQRVALARGFVFDPEIFLMDEPFAALDELTRREMNHMLLDIHQQVEKTTVFVTHHIPEAVWLSDRVIVLTERPGTVEEIVNIDLPRPRDDETRQRDAFIEYEESLTQRLIDTE